MPLWCKKKLLSQSFGRTGTGFLKLYWKSAKYTPYLFRWAVIGWLLSTCTSRVATSYSNLALFWDWLFYSPEKNSIMDMEPGILVMYQSLRNHPAITTSLLDFLCRTMVEFHPPLVNQVCVLFGLCYDKWRTNFGCIFAVAEDEFLHCMRCIKSFSVDIAINLWFNGFRMLWM